MRLLNKTSIFLVTSIVGLSACKPKQPVGFLLSSSSGYNCNDHGDICSFKDDVTNGNFRGKQPEDTVSQYLSGDATYRNEVFENYINPDFAEFKNELYNTAKDVFGDDRQTLALIVAMGMLETNELRGWDIIKDEDNDGSANFGIFNMNEDFLNSIRHDLTKDGRTDPIEYVDSSSRGKGFWFKKFNRSDDSGYKNDGRLNLKAQLIYLKNAFELWGVTNTLIIHRSGYDGLKSSDPLRVQNNSDYLNGMRKITNRLIEKPQMFEPSDDLESSNGALIYRVSASIPHI